MKGFLMLANGETFSGEWVSQSQQEFTDGEIVFFTGMTGYQEVLTDPSYKGQIVVFTYPLIGNYGINEKDFESNKPHVAGVIVYEMKEVAFHYEAKHSLKEYLQKWNIPLLSHVDTRSIVKKIRDYGSMQALLTKHKNAELVEGVSEVQVVKKVSVISPKTIGVGNFHVVLVDFGYKRSILNALLNRNCRVTVVPYDTSFDQIAKYNPDGIILSNGPGDPQEIEPEFNKINKLIHHYPVLGICLGHQLAALALGARTKKLLFGHRGANHPVLDKKLNKVLISSQNHSFVVEEESIAETNLLVRFINLHDQSIEGFVHHTLPLRTVQFHPEANPGPSDSEYIFDEFIEELRQKNGRVFAYA